MRSVFLVVVAPFIGTALLLWTSTACNPPNRQAAKDELAAYLQLMGDWAPVEAETGRVIDRILATQFVDEAEVRRQVAADAPRVRAHIERIAGTDVRSSELREIHRQYVNAWRQVGNAYDRLLRGLDAPDASELALARRGLVAWRQEIVDTARALRRHRDDLAG